MVAHLAGMPGLWACMLPGSLHTFNSVAAGRLAHNQACALQAHAPFIHCVRMLRTYMRFDQAAHAGAKQPLHESLAAAAAACAAHRRRHWSLH